MENNKPEVIDEWDEAVQPAGDFSPFLYGKCLVDVWKAITEKGVKPRAFIEGVDADNKKTWMCHFRMEVIPQMQYPYEVSREWPNWNKEYQNIFLTSVKNAGFVKSNGMADLKALNGAWCKVEKVDGDQINPKTNSPYKTFTIVAQYKNETECIAAYDQETWGGAQVSNTEQGQENNPESSQKAKQALQFAQVFVNQAVKQYPSDKAKIISKLDSDFKANKSVSDYLTVDSPEVVDMINYALEEPPF